MSIHSVVIEPDESNKPTYSTIEPRVSSQTMTTVLLAPILIAGFPRNPRAGVTNVLLIKTWNPLLASSASMQ